MKRNQTIISNCIIYRSNNLANEIRWKDQTVQYQTILYIDQIIQLMKLGGKENQTILYIDQTSLS